MKEDNNIKNQAKKTGAVLVVGAGIAGIQASLDLANSGFKVYLAEKSPFIGGKMTQLDKTFPTNDCATCIVSPKLVECGRHLNIEKLTLAEVEEVKGEAGDFTVTIKRKPRYVDIKACTSCDECSKVCPVEIISEHNAGLTTRKAIYKPYAQAYPNGYALDKLDTAPCKLTCPVHISIQGYIALISQGKFKEAIDLVRERMPFPAICGRICNHSCEKICRRGLVDQPIAINSMKRFLADWEMENGGCTFKPAEIVHDEKIAIIGGGPAGLTTAHDLTLLGYHVTVFEARGEAGGMLYSGIPEYRLPREIVRREIDNIMSLGIELKLNSRLGDDFSIKDLKKQGYKAIFLAVGAQKSRDLQIEGVQLNGVLKAVEFLSEVNLEAKANLGGKVIVIGGGNVAVDAARSAIRMGAKEVRVVSLESQEEMPSAEEEIKEAKEEGIIFNHRLGPNRILGEEGRVTGLETVAVKSVFDDQGRFNPVFIPDTESNIPADSIIIAIGQTPDLSFIKKEDGIEINGRGTIAVDVQTLATTAPGIFAGGDAVSGPATFVEAVATGHRAALLIDAYLRGKDQSAVAPAEEKKIIDLREEELKEKIRKGLVKKRARVEMPALSAEQRLHNFNEVEQGLIMEMAQEEAQRCLDCGICSECWQCAKACPPKCIHYEELPRLEELKVGAIILAPGYEVYDAYNSPEFGFGRYPNVVTSLQFERILSAAGPTEGHVKRPSDSQKPKKIAFLQCIGSRDQNHDYCSSVCCMYATKDAILAKEHEPDLEVDIYIMDMRAFGKGYDDYYNRAVEKYGIRYIHSRPSAIKEIPQNKNLLIKYQDEGDGIKTQEYDLVILSVGIGPCSSSFSLSQKLNIKIDEFGFHNSDIFQPLVSDNPGIFVCGAFTGPEDIPESVVQASGSAALAASLLAEARGSLVVEKIYPPEKDVSSEEARVGVFVCHCGSNIAGVVNVNEVAEYVRSLPGVVYAETNLFTCSQDTILQIREKIKEHNLNRIVVSACTPVTHAPIFQETMQEAGLNPYLFEMANIRNQCSWVHAREPEKATVKAMELVRMSVARAINLEPLKKLPLPLNHGALVLGGGISGMTASLTLADQGFEVYLVEREGQLGGIANRIHYTLENRDPKEVVLSLVKKVRQHPRVHLYLGTELKKFAGFVGNFRSTLSRKIDDVRVEDIDIEHGAIIIATGGQEYTGTDYGYGLDKKIITQLELEERIANDGNALNGIKDVVMIQCVGSRTKDHPYCSRICCGEAVKNALKLKEINPESRIFVLYKDIMTYGLLEKYYTEAREKGIIFIRYDDEHLPEMVNADRLKVRVYEPIMNEVLEIQPDLVVLSVGVTPSDGYKELSQLLKAPIDQDGFFLEAHIKLRPVDVAFEGIFLCGLSNYPKYIRESIAQAQAAAARAATILSRKFLEVGGAIAEVDSEKCVACLSCVRTCPYYVPVINMEGVAQIDPAACQGCGICSAECPVRAISLRNYLDGQIIPKIESLFVGGV